MRKRIICPARISRHIDSSDFHTFPRGSDNEKTFIVPKNKPFTPSVIGMYVGHIDSAKSHAKLDMCVYVLTACYGWKKEALVIDEKIRKAQLILEDSARLQTVLLSNGYTYDAEYCCYDGSVAMIKSIKSSRLPKELEILARLTTNRQKQ